MGRGFRTVCQKDLKGDTLMGLEKLKSHMEDLLCRGKEFGLCFEGIEGWILNGAQVDRVCISAGALCL